MLEHAENDLLKKMLDKNNHVSPLKRNNQEFMLDDLSDGDGCDENKQKEFYLNSAIVSAGDFGLYHIVNLTFLSLVWVIIPSIPLMLPYFRMMPNFMCQNSDSTIRQCTIQEICDNTISKINPHSPLKTWATDFNLFCEKSIYFGFLGSLYFLGILTGNLFIAKFTDSYGRKPVLVAYLILYLFVSLLTIFAWTYYVFFIVSFFVGVIYSGTSMCAFVLNYESSSKELKSTFSTILSMSYGFGAIIHILIFYYFENWIITVSITSVLTIILLIFTFHLQESPEFLYMKCRYLEMIKVLEYIANMNKRSKELDMYLKSTNIFELVSNQTREEKINGRSNDEIIYGVIEVFFLPDQRWILLIMAFNWFVMTLTFYAINFNVSNFGTNPYFTGILVYLSESLAQMLCLYFIINYGFRLTLCGSYLLSAITLITLNFLDTDSNWIIKFGLIFLAKFGVSGVNNSNYIFTAELFPVIIRVAAMSFCSLMSRFGGMAGTLVIDMTDYAMTILGVLCLVTTIILYKNERIKETDFD